MNAPIAPTSLELTCQSVQQFVTETVVTAENWILNLSNKQELLANFTIVLSEALNNIVEHAYEYRETGTIQIAIKYADGVITIHLKDDGKKMPGLPVRRVMDGHTRDFEDLPEGGFGWFLIHSLTSDMDYEYTNGSNNLTLLVS